jgi:hypothetical protein
LGFSIVYTINMEIKLTYAYKLECLSIAILLAISGVAIAADPPYIYKEFGYSPPNIELGQLNETQRAVLDSCVSFAKERETSARSNSGRMAAIYGTQARQYDYFGVYLTGCLTDEKDGKGWLVYQKTLNDWQAVKSRYATRTFMQLDPSQ